MKFGAFGYIFERLLQEFRVIELQHCTPCDFGFYITACDGVQKLNGSVHFDAQ